MWNLNMLYDHSQKLWRPLVELPCCFFAFHPWGWRLEVVNSRMGLTWTRCACAYNSEQQLESLVFTFLLFLLSVWLSFFSLYYWLHQRLLLLLSCFVENKWLCCSVWPRVFCYGLSQSQAVTEANKQPLPSCVGWKRHQASTKWSFNKNRALTNIARFTMSVLNSSCTETTAVPSITAENGTLLWQEIMKKGKLGFK